MKVVLFCGGQGLRLRDYSESVPKPMVPIGYRPILWHVMRYYAHFGYHDFTLCLGYRADVIKDYFLRYNEALSNDFVMSDGGREIELLGSDITGWRITFTNTGQHSNIGQRLKKAQRFIGDDEIFLANYSDSVTDAPLPELVDDFLQQDKIAAFLAVKPTATFHVVSLKDDGVVKDIQDFKQGDTWINGGFFIFRREIFDYLGPGEELVEEPFRRLAEQEQLIAYRHEGFWAPMDTLKDQRMLEDLYNSGNPPWALWQTEEE